MVDANRSGKCTHRPECVVWAGRTAVGGGDDVGEGVGVFDGVELGRSVSAHTASRWAGLRRSNDTVSWRPFKSNLKYLSPLDNTR